MDELIDCDATDLATLIRSRHVRAREAVDAALRRIEARNPDLGAVTYLDADAAMTKADDIDARIERGDSVGPLAGVPTLVKDLYVSVPGWPATVGGVPSLRDERGPEGVWSAYAGAMSSAGAIILGQTNSSSFGFRGVTDNALFGPTRNPFDVERNAGGSSGGAAAAVATGMVPVAGASDAGGSIRIPSAWCGTFGYQPGVGRVPSRPRPVGFHLGPYLYEGPVARTVADAALVTRSLVTFDAHDPLSTPASAFDPFQHIGRGVEGLRVAYARDFGGFPIDPGIARVMDDAVATLEQLGAYVEPIDMGLPTTHDAMTEVWLRSVASLILTDIDTYGARGIDLLADPGVPDAVRHWIEQAQRMSTRAILADREVRTGVLDAFLEVHERFDIVVGPTVVSPPVRNAARGETVGPTSIAGVTLDPLIGWCPAYLTNFTGAPSASVPVGFADGLPVGLLVIARKCADGDVFAVSAALEEARPWRYSYP